MKKFKYRLQSYLRFTELKRDLAQKEVGVAKSYLNKLQNKKIWMEQEMKKGYEKLSQFGKAEINIHQVEDNNSFLILLKSQMQDLTQQIHMAEHAYNDKMNKLINLQIELKKIEKHKENAQEQHRKSVQKDRQKKIDDLNTIRFGRS